MLFYLMRIFDFEIRPQMYDRYNLCVYRKLQVCGRYIIFNLQFLWSQSIIAHLFYKLDTGQRKTTLLIEKGDLYMEKKIWELLIANDCIIFDKNMSVDDELSKYGMDSMKFINILAIMEETFDIKIPDEKLWVFEQCTLRKLAQLVQYVQNV